MSKTSEQLTAQYQHHAFNLGHKLSVITALEFEIADHKFEIKKLQKELNKLPQPVTQPHVVPDAAPIEAEAVIETPAVSA